jgi:formylmethanofuran dehydrogenase subunit A
LWVGEKLVRVEILNLDKKYEKDFYKMLKNYYTIKYQQAHILEEYIKNFLPSEFLSK